MQTRRESLSDQTAWGIQMDFSIGTTVSTTGIGVRMDFSISTASGQLCFQHAILRAKKRDHITSRALEPSEDYGEEHLERKHRRESTPTRRANFRTLRARSRAYHYTSMVCRPTRRQRRSFNCRAGSSGSVDKLHVTPGYDCNSLKTSGPEWPIALSVAAAVEGCLQ